MKKLSGLQTQKQQTLDSLEKFVKYGSFALAGLSLVLKLRKVDKLSSERLRTLIKNAVMAFLLVYNRTLQLPIDRT